jgi:hypothetical protein
VKLGSTSVTTQDFREVEWVVKNYNNHNPDLQGSFSDSLWKSQWVFPK